jgi:RNA polymerase subunit RPABC4/transcription elongation factor Spt4
MSEFFDACIGSMKWEACQQCDYLEEDNSCPMDALDLTVENDLLLCTLYIPKRTTENG